MRFGNIQRIIVFGGGRTCYEFVKLCKSRNIDTRIVTSDRHAREKIDGESFFRRIDGLGNNAIITDRLNDPNVINLITPNAMGVSFGAAWIFTPDVIDSFQKRFVNVHAAPLPRFRGAGGFSWRILCGDRQGALCLHLVDRGIDTGEIVRIEHFNYPTSCRTPTDYMNYTLDQNIEFLGRFLDDVLSNSEFNLSTQDENASTYFPRLNTEIHGFIDWSWNAQAIKRFVRAFDSPYAGASSFLNRGLVRLRQCALAKDDEHFHPFLSGLVYRKSSAGIWIATNDIGIYIKVVEDIHGNRLLDRISCGDRFHTPSSYLEDAKTFRAVYTPKGLKKA